jgi:hypothetical protein
MILVILMKGDCSAFPVNFIFNHAIALDVAHALLDNLNQPDYKIDLGKLLNLLDKMSTRLCGRSLISI